MAKKAAVESTMRQEGLAKMNYHPAQGESVSAGEKPEPGTAEEEPPAPRRRLCPPRRRRN